MKNKNYGTVINLERINPLAGDAWDALITGRENHSIFHRSAWARVLAETYGHQPVYLRIFSNDNEAALVPLMEVRSPLTGCRGVSLPFSDFAGPLWTDPDQADKVYAALAELARERKWKHTDLRGGGPPPGRTAAFQTFESHQLDLRPGLESLEKGVASSVRRALRKADGRALRLSVETGEDDIGSFYRLHVRTRRRHGLPPQPESFFRSISKHLLQRDHGMVVLARLGATPVAGAVFFWSGGNAIYKFGASDPRHWPLRPNQRVMWAAIEHLVGIGCRSLHFGRTSKGDEGLARFKRSWGCDSSSLRYDRYDPVRRAWLPPASPRAESHPLIFGHLPLVINRLAGRLVYPHLD